MSVPKMKWHAGFREPRVFIIHSHRQNLSTFTCGTLQDLNKPSIYKIIPFLFAFAVSVRSFGINQCQTIFKCIS